MADNKSNMAPRPQRAPDSGPPPTPEDMAMTKEKLIEMGHPPGEAALLEKYLHGEVGIEAFFDWDPVARSRAMNGVKLDADESEPDQNDEGEAEEPSEDGEQEPPKPRRG